VAADESRKVSLSRGPLSLINHRRFVGLYGSIS